MKKPKTTIIGGKEYNLDRTTSNLLENAWWRETEEGRVYVILPKKFCGGLVAFSEWLDYQELAHPVAFFATLLAFSIITIITFAPFAVPYLTEGWQIDGEFYFFGTFTILGVLLTAFYAVQLFRVLMSISQATGTE